MLNLKNVSKYYAKEGVISKGFTNVNLELYLGEFVVITGESGSGKSTLLNVLSGLDSYEDGELYINGEETSHYSEEDYLAYRRKYVSNIFQNFNLVNSYTVYQNIELALLMNGYNRKNIKTKVNDLINKVGLKKHKNTMTSKLSGGQKQRVAIARALANDTPIIIADEPTGALDSKASKEIIKLLYEISENKLVIVVTHNKNEIENYATRLIKMHDGRIIEDKIVKDINLDKTLEEKEVKSITILNKLFLGIRNTFNLPIKFTLMFVIFSLIIVALITNYGLFQAMKYESNNYGYNEYFMDTSDYRIIVKKDNGTIFTNSDYEVISKLENVDKIIQEDLLLDFDLGLYGDNYYLYGTIGIDDIKFVDEGRMPINDNEVVIKGNKDIWYLKNDLESLYNEKFAIETYSNSVFDKNIKVVGIVYDNEISYNGENIEFYFSKKTLEELSLSLNARYNDLLLFVNDNYFNLYDMFYKGIVLSDKVMEGEVIINDNLNSYCKNYDCKNNNLIIERENIYSKNNISLKISDSYNQYNSKRLFNKSYEEIEGSIFINKKDYNKLFTKENYQSSIFVKELKDLNNLEEKLNNLGYNSLKLRDAKVTEGSEILQIIKIFKLIVTVALIITLFLISYFIIKIIYKSRNSYYTTLRTLGGTKKVCISILRNELFMLATFVYFIFLLIIILVNKNIFKFQYFTEITKYLTITEYVIVYIILILLSILISNKYGRKIFKNSIIKTYGERI